MKHSLKTGLSFGLTSGTITTLGLMVGLLSGTNSRFVVIGGILTIAIADAFSDALGIHMSEESENKHNEKEIWESTIITFLSKAIYALSFLIPVFLIPDLFNAVIVNIIYGLSILCILSYYISKEQKTKAWKVIMEHLVIAMLVIVIAYFLGEGVRIIFG